MAFTRLTIEGYGQVELNNAAFRRDGRIEAQCAPDTTDFNGTVYVENGMLLDVDAGARKVAFYDASNTALGHQVALVYSAEHLYDAAKQGLKDFKLNGKNDFLPRLGYLAIGDKFTTNCVGYDSGEFASETALFSAMTNTTLYGAVSSKGAIAISSTAPTAYDGVPILKFVKKTTMPDGSVGIQFTVVH